MGPRDENKNNRNINNNCRDKIKCNRETKEVGVRAHVQTHTQKEYKAKSYPIRGGVGGSQSRGRVSGLKTNGKLAMHLRSHQI